jgi:hypothetical protein
MYNYKLLPFLFFLFALIQFQGCNQDDSLINANLEMKLSIIPSEEVTVDWGSCVYQHNTNLPITVDSSTYDSIANFLKNSNLIVEDMWCPYDDMLCRIPIIIGKEIIVKLNKPDTRILSYNFEPTNGDFPIVCFRNWRHYKYSVNRN